MRRSRERAEKGPVYVYMLSVDKNERWKAESELPGIEGAVDMKRIHDLVRNARACNARYEIYNIHTPRLTFQNLRG